MYLCLVSLLLTLSHSPSPSYAAAAGNLAFFLDEQCEEASTSHPSIALPIDTCLVTPGALGIAIQSLPACGSAGASFTMYLDTSCANPDKSR
ncbi:MAG: hypothetical protein Q9218_008408, partial [Villophora microphyllina]